MPSGPDGTPPSSEPPDVNLGSPDHDAAAVNLPDVSFRIYECHECGDLILAVNPSDGTVTCHGQPMAEVTDWEFDVNSPDLDAILLDAFGLPKTGLDICLCVIDEGPLAPEEVADRLDYDRSTVSQYLNDLVAIGLLERAQLNREGGGVVNVYHSIDVERMRREALLGLYVWAGRAGSRLEEANLLKQSYFEDDPDDRLNQVFWEAFQLD